MDAMYHVWRALQMASHDVKDLLQKRETESTATNSHACATSSGGSSPPGTLAGPVQPEPVKRRWTSWPPAPIVNLLGADYLSTRTGCYVSEVPARFVYIIYTHAYGDCKLYC